MPRRHQSGLRLDHLTVYDLQNLPLHILRRLPHHLRAQGTVGGQQRLEGAHAAAHPEVVRFGGQIGDAGGRSQHAPQHIDDLLIVGRIVDRLARHDQIERLVVGLLLHVVRPVAGEEAAALQLAGTVAAVQHRIRNGDLGDDLAVLRIDADCSD